MLTRLRALAIKETLAILRDPKTRVILVVPPIVQVIIFAFAATQEVTNVSIAILDEDRGAWAFELNQRIRGSHIVREIVDLRGVPEIRPAIDQKRVLAVVHIPQTFSADLEAGRPAAVQAIFDGRRANASQILQGYLGRIVDQFNADRAGAGHRRGLASAVAVRNWYNANLDFKWFTLPCLTGVLTMMITMILTALSVAREREFGTFEQLLVSPLTRVEILIGKTLPALLIGLFEGTLILAVAVVGFRVPFTGSLVLLYGATVVFAACVIGVGLFISSLSNTQQQAILGGFTCALPAIVLSGFLAPVENMPNWLQTADWVNPLRHFLVITKGLFLKDMPADAVLEHVWPMAVTALVTLSVATWFFRRRIE
jgi:ABC-2 type transport system permease protein